MKTPEELYSERTKRVQDAIELKVPDRVPFTPTFSFFPPKYAGITCEEAMYDPDKLSLAYKKAVLDFEPDMYSSYANLTIGPMLETLQCRWLKWPGHGVSPNAGFQFVEGEHMRAEEYDDFLFDPTDFILRVFMPRAYGALEPLKILPPLPSLYYTRFLTGASVFGRAEVAEAFQALLESGREAQRAMSRAAEFTKEMAGLGFPCQFGGVAYAPFDYLGDLLRGTRGIMLDMYRQPKKLLAALDKFVPLAIDMGVRTASMGHNPMVFIPLHKGADGFMSDKDFKTFYWPTLKAVILGLIQEGLVPYIFVEGGYNQRLDVIADPDIPKGTTIWIFDQTDMKEVKKHFTGWACFGGNVPVSWLKAATPQEVSDHVKGLIDDVGRDGGYILSTGAVLDDAQAENLHAMIETGKQYGKY